MTMSLDSLLASLETDAGIEKQASASTEVEASVYQSISDILTGKSTEDMQKRAMEEGASLAKELLSKLAAETNLIPIQTAQLAAEDVSKVVPTSGGTIEESLKATVDNGLERGATSDDRVDDGVDAGKGVPAGDPIDTPTEYPQQTEKKANDMTTNSDLAKRILEKLAETGAAPISTDTSNGTNMVIQNDQRLTASDDKKVTPLPGAEGTISNIFEQVVATAQAQGAGTDNLAEVPGAKEPEQRLDVAAGDEVEKAAAVSSLVAEGVPFDTAVSLVKQAEAELAQEAAEQEKQAALNALVEEGYSFDDAVALVKQAEWEMEKEAAFAELRNEGYDFDTAVSMVKKAEEELLKEAGVVDTVAKAAKGFAKNVAGDAKALPGQVKAFAKGTDLQGKAMPRKAMVKALAQNKALVGGTATVAGGAAVAGHKKSAEEIGQEKVAAFNTLIENGIDFDTATSLVNQAEQDLYGTK